MRLLLLAVTVFLTVQTGAATLDLTNCTVCQNGGCPAGVDDCYLHCDDACPVGYSSSPAASGVCDTGPDGNTSTPMPMPMASSVAPIPQVMDPTTPQTNASVGPQRELQCRKCEIANCSSCPYDQYDYNCSECMTGLRLVLQKSGHLNIMTRLAACVSTPDGSGGTDGGDENQPSGGGGGGGGGGSSPNKGVLAGGVVAGGVAVLVVASIIIFVLWRRRKASTGKEMMTMMTKKKKKKPQDSDDDERSESRYTKSPVREQPSMGTEISEVNKLPQAPDVPQENYDALEPKRQNSVQPYAQLEMKQTDSVYGNSASINHANQQKNGTYANLAGTETEEGPSEIYGNEEVLQGQGQGDAPQEAYMDMSGSRPAQDDPAGEELYLNNSEATASQLHGTHAAEVGLVQDEVYNNDFPLTEEDVYLNQPADTQDDVYNNEGVELVEENIYGNT